MLVAVAVCASVCRSFPLHVQVGSVHGISLHIRPHGVDLVGSIALADEVIVHKICISTLQLIALVDLLGGALNLRRCVRYGIRRVHRLPHILALAGGPRVLLLGRAAGGTREAIS